MWEAKEILSPDPCEGVLWLDVVEEAGGRGGAACVVRDFQQIGAEMGVTFRKDLFGAFFDIARQEETGFSVGHKHHEGVVVGVERPIIGGAFVGAGEWMEDIDAHFPDHPSGGARKAACWDALFV